MMDNGCETVDRHIKSMMDKGRETVDHIKEKLYFYGKFIGTIFLT